MVNVIIKQTKGIDIKLMHIYNIQQLNFETENAQGIPHSKLVAEPSNNKGTLSDKSTNKNWSKIKVYMHTTHIHPPSPPTFTPPIELHTLS